jgi:hypothetical protein
MIGKILIATWAAGLALLVAWPVRKFYMRVL